MVDFIYKERNKDVLCYLRLVINQKMKALVRVINYPARGIGNNNQLTIAKSLQTFDFEVMKIYKIDLKLNSEQTKIWIFVTIQSFQVINENQDVLSH
jgi:superfamily I DNA/RNA helicase